MLISIIGKDIQGDFLNKITNFLEWIGFYYVHDVKSGACFEASDSSGYLQGFRLDQAELEDPYSDFTISPLLSQYLNREGSKKTNPVLFDNGGEYFLNFDFLRFLQENSTSVVILRVSGDGDYLEWNGDRVYGDAMIILHPNQEPIFKMEGDFLVEKIAEIINTEE